MLAVPVVRNPVVLLRTKLFSQLLPVVGVNA